MPFKPDPNDDDAYFAYRSSRSGMVFISWYGREVVTLKGKQASKFLRQIEGMNDQQAQLLMARMTGNFKRGNERLGKNRR